MVSLSHPYPRCNLYNLRIVNDLPPACPLSEALPYDGIHRLELQGYSLLATPERGGGTVAMARAGVCERCIGRLLANGHVRRLREALAADEPTAPTQPKELVQIGLHRPEPDHHNGMATTATARGPEQPKPGKPIIATKRIARRRAVRHG